MPVDNELLLEYFLTFSKIEYALKISGFFQHTAPKNVNPIKPPDAKPDWDNFANSLRNSFDRNSSEVLTDACNYFFDQPPNKQVIVNEGVAWESPVIPNNEHSIQFLLRMIRSVRNNLFHGGKFNNEDEERTTLLLINSLIILRECLKLSPDVNNRYDHAVI